MKHSCLYLLTAALLFFTCATSHCDELTWDNDFSRGLRGWQLGGNCKLKREGAMLYVRLVGPEDNGVAACRSPIVELDGQEHEYELSCTYRTEVKESHLHGGAWFIFFKKDENEKMVGDWTGMMLEKSDDWTTTKGTVQIPAGVKTFQTNIRVQGRKGKVLEVRAVTLKKIR